ncbi:tetratricopeptide repeat protein [Hydrogenophaga sp.]|uniref:tetratricopeptide repeat protein n=1 Tax=Hydrogenophaga sp. TaxID=1904254 RepID=UPI0025C14277|nr:tetratricopeptide repeat protein [Hydrogenophaga sp.]
MTPTGDIDMIHPRTLLGAALVVLTSTSQAQDSHRGDWLRNPAMGNYKAYAEFKMAHYAEAREVWETLAEVGNGDALFNLGILAEDGLGEPKNMKKAETLYTSSAHAGNFKAQYRLGMLYSAGTLLPRDVERARIFLTLAAQGGDKDATATLVALGQPTASLTPYQRAEFLSATGEHTQAAALYRQLAEGGDRRAQTRLAWMYEAGRGVERDLAEAARRFESAAVDGEAEAQYALAVMYRTGKGREHDVAQSLVWLRKAAGQSYPPALAALGSSESAGVK